MKSIYAIIMLSHLETVKQISEIDAILIGSKLPLPAIAVRDGNLTRYCFYWYRE
jgi:hypothetical protein